MSNKPYLFVSFKSWKKTEKATILSFLRNGKNTTLVAGPKLEIPLVGVSHPSHHYIALRNQLEVRSDNEFPLSLTKYEVTIKGCKDKTTQKFLYDLTVLVGGKVVVQKVFCCKKQWSFLGVQSLIKHAEDRSYGQDDQKIIDSLSESKLEDFQIVLTYKNGILRFDDLLGTGVWGMGIFALSTESLINELASSSKLTVETIFEEISRLIQFTQNPENHIDLQTLELLVDKVYLEERLAVIRDFLHFCAQSKSNEVPKIQNDLIKDADSFLKALNKKSSALDEIKRFDTNNKGAKINQFCSIDAFQDKQAPLFSQTEEKHKADAKADGYIWRLSRIFNEEVAKLCNSFISLAISKRNIKINDPFNETGDFMYSQLLTHDIGEHNVQLLRPSIFLEGSAICIVIREKKTNMILLWQKLTTSMPPQCSFGIIDDNLFFLHSDSTDPSRTFETRSINLIHLISEASKRDIHSVLSMNSDLVSWDQGSSATIAMATYRDMLATVNSQYELFVWTELKNSEIIKKEKGSKTAVYKFSKGHPPTECTAFTRIINHNLILIVFFKEFAFKTFLVSQKENNNLSYSVLDRYETLFDAAVEQEEGGKNQKQSTFSQNCPYPFHYPILIKMSVGHLLILPYKGLDFELLLISENVRLLHLATKPKTPKLLFVKFFPDAFAREPKDGKITYKAIDSTKKMYESYFSADSTNPSRINIVVVKKQKSKTPESIRVIRCMLKL